MLEQDNSFLALTVEEFLQASEEFLMEKMESGFHWYRSVYQIKEESPGPSQVESWRDCIEVLQEALIKYPLKKDWLVFEYCLPQEGGRRPDVLLINSACVTILEFKRKALPALAADIDQAAAYRADIKECHAMSHEMEVESYLVLTKERSDVLNYLPDKEITILSCSRIAEALCRRKAATEIEIRNWLQAAYEPSITILEAAYRVMEGEALPEIRRAKSIGINDTLKKLEQLYQVTKEYDTHSVVFITGVPGAGKTYLGLQYTYHISKESKTAVYLSGNGPLIEILQHILKNASRTLVRPINKFLRGNVSQRGTYTTVVFDEGQRAWNSRKGNASEPEELIEFLHSLPWGMLVILVGEGQQIWTNETVSPADWAKAIAKFGNPNIFCPPDFKKHFMKLNVRTSPELNLTNSLRTAMDALVPNYFKCLLAGEITEAAAIAAQIRGHYPLYITREPEEVANYCWERYEGQPRKKYGWVRSSQYNRQRNKRKSPAEYVPWFTAEPSSQNSCCAMNLDKAVTEFECQGLEVNFVAIEWGMDLLWEEGWKPYCTKQDKENETYRINAYRVLLTRGRDGVYIYVPKRSELDETFTILKKAGFIEETEEITGGGIS